MKESTKAFWYAGSQAVLTAFLVFGLVPSRGTMIAVAVCAFLSGGNAAIGCLRAREGKDG